ncbi:aminoglycoside phosphotransferase family protein [Paenibacillus sp. 32O-W]|uniref:aminoglycoside phosphotransferase family protein n=1 Tax=Paenibacillus sp. 32O-W TaxID=1695218 RepID=UPI0011A98376|nr:aminoglycoside phosphotransferase family protein [Paenibacillus sp. 32O-W]
MNKLKTILKEHYSLEIKGILPQQGGWAALAYKVSGDSGTYFLKAYEKSRASTPKWTALIDKYVPITIWLLQNSGLKGKLPVPLVTKQGEYKCEDEEGIYLLYEYIDGETIGDRDLSGEQVRQLSEMIAELHSYGEEIPPDTDAIKEDFCIPFMQRLRSTLGGEYSRVPAEIREVTDPYLEQVKGLMDTVDKLSAGLKCRSLRMALCHTDIHHWNLMQAGQQLMLLDWEGLKLAPVEADIMFMTDKPYYEDFVSIYKQVHSDYTVDPDVLLFYQGRRKLEDIWEWMEQLLFDRQNAKERAASIQYLANELKTIGG